MSAYYVNSFDVNMDEKSFSRFLNSGSLDGYFSYDEFWKFFEDVRGTSNNGVFISPTYNIGKSYQGRDMKGFYLCDNTSQLHNYQKEKNIVFITSLHHPREPLSLTMVMLIIREVVKSLKETGHNQIKEMMRDSMIFMIPVVNPDSYIYINKNFYGPDSDQIKMVRKNRHTIAICAPWLGGVDLNRNYDMKFGADEDGSSSDPCKEDYRGTHPFSEPETLAIKNYVDAHPKIVSNVNIHTFGNSWIYPFNYVHDKQNHLLEKKYRLYFDFYKDFTDSMKRKHLSALFGNAFFALDYTTNGEAGDWFTGKKKILNIDLELGNLDRKSESFYPPQSILADIVRYNWLAMSEFLSKHSIDFSHKVVIYPSQINFELINNGLSALIDPALSFEYLTSSNQPVRVSDTKYCIKNVLEDHCQSWKRFNNKITETIGGRHVLEIQLGFADKNEYARFGSMKMIIQRPRLYMNYKDQCYLFKKSN